MSRTPIKMDLNKKKGKKNMKNKKMVFGTILFLFAITGICNIQNVSANSFVDTIYIPALHYAGFNMGYLENGDTILINDISSDGTINVYIMREWAFGEYQDSGDIYYLKKWENVISLKGWTFDITGSGDIYYLVLVNNALLTGREVDIDISVDYYVPYVPYENIFMNPLVSVIILIVVIVAIVLIIAIPIILVRKHKKKTPKEVIIIQKEVPKNIYCQECGALISDKDGVFCPKCGNKITN